VRAPISTTCPSTSCRITTRLASHARRRDVSAGTRAPSSRTGPADPGQPAPRRRRGLRPDSVRLARRDRVRDGEPFPRAGSAHPPAARRPVWMGGHEGPPKPPALGSTAAKPRRSSSISDTRRPRTPTMPSSSGYTYSARLLCWRAASRFSAMRSTSRQPRTIRSTCSAVPARATASSRSSVSGVATRVRARTLEYDSSPRARRRPNAVAFRGARATRTFSWAAPRSSPTRQVSHAAQERKPLVQPPRPTDQLPGVRYRLTVPFHHADLQ
jgi:hypothetical protein